MNVDINKANSATIASGHIKGPMTDMAVVTKSRLIKADRENNVGKSSWLKQGS